MSDWDSVTFSVGCAACPKQTSLSELVPFRALKFRARVDLRLCGPLPPHPTRNRLQPNFLWRGDVRDLSLGVADRNSLMDLRDTTRGLVLIVCEAVLKWFMPQIFPMQNELLLVFHSMSLETFCDMNRLKTCSQTINTKVLRLTQIMWCQLPKQAMVAVAPNLFSSKDVYMYSQIPFRDHSL